MKLQATIDFEIDYEIDVITPGPILSPEDILNAWQIRLDDFFNTFHSIISHEVKVEEV